MDVSKGNKLYLNFLMNNEEQHLREVLKLLLQGDMAAYLNLSNHLRCALPIVSLTSKKKNTDMILSTLRSAAFSDKNPYAMAFFAHPGKSNKKSAHGDPILIYKKLADMNIPLGFVELGKFEYYSASKEDSFTKANAIYKIEKTLLLDPQFDYAHLIFGDCFALAKSDFDKAIQHYLIAEKAELPGAASSLAKIYLQQEKFDLAKEYLSKTSDEYLRRKHLTYALYYEMTAKSNEDYINAFKHHLIAYALNALEEYEHMREDLGRYIMSENLDFSSVCISTLNKMLDTIKKYEATTNTKPLSINEILNTLSEDFDKLNEFNIAEIVRDPLQWAILKQKAALNNKIEQLEQNQVLLYQMKQEAEKNMLQLYESLKNDEKATPLANLLKIFIDSQHIKKH